jgi:hypothetical protein
MLGISRYNRTMKKKKNYTDQLNFLASDGTRNLLIAIAYLRGDRLGRYAPVAKDFIEEGIQKFREGLTERDKKAFNEILANVTTAEAYRKED